MLGEFQNWEKTGLLMSNSFKVIFHTIRTISNRRKYFCCKKRAFNLFFQREKMTLQRFWVLKTADLPKLRISKPRNKRIPYFYLIISQKIQKITHEFQKI